MAEQKFCGDLSLVHVYVAVKMECVLFSEFGVSLPIRSLMNTLDDVCSNKLPSE